MKKHYYIGVNIDDGLVLVTALDNSTKTVLWNVNKAPFEFSGISVVRNIVEGMRMNLIDAVLVEVNEVYTKQPFVRAKGE